MKLDTSTIVTIALAVGTALTAWGQFQAHVADDQKQLDGIITVVRIDDQRIDDLRAEVAILKQRIEDGK